MTPHHPTTHRRLFAFALAIGLAAVLLSSAPGASAAEPVQSVLEPASAAYCPAKLGMCAKWRLRSATNGAVWAVVTTAVPVVFGQLKIWTTEASDDGLRTRFSWTGTAGKTETLPLRTVVAPLTAVPYTLTLSPGLEVVKPPAALRPDIRDWEKDRKRLMARAPSPKFSRSGALMKADLGYLKRDAWEVVQMLMGTFNGPLLVDFPVTPDRCYTLVMKFKGKWSAEARRGTHGRFIGPDGKPMSAFDWYYRDAANFGMVCPKKAGWSRLQVMAARDLAAPWAGNVATGRWTMAVWAKPSGPFAYPDSALGPLVKAETKGMRKVATLSKGQLEDLGPIDIVMKKMKCYVAVLRLGTGASWSDATRAQSNVGFDAKLAGLNVSGGPGARGAGAVGHLSCHLAARPGVLTVRAVGAKAGAPLGTGPYTLELYEGAYRGAELADEKRELRRQRRTVKEVVQDAEWETCRWCAKRRAVCDDVGDTGCAAGFKRCVSKAGYKAKRCGI